MFNTIVLKSIFFYLGIFPFVVYVWRKGKKKDKVSEMFLPAGWVGCLELQLKWRAEIIGVCLTDGDNYWGPHWQIGPECHWTFAPITWPHSTFFISPVLSPPLQTLHHSVWLMQLQEVLLLLCCFIVSSFSFFSLQSRSFLQCRHESVWLGCLEIFPVPPALDVNLPFSCLPLNAFVPH